jgi:hypothetical protein
VKPLEASWYALIVLKSCLWLTLAWCLLICLTSHSDAVHSAGIEAAEKMLGQSLDSAEYFRNKRLAEAINPMSGIPFAILFTAGFLAVLHSLDLIRYRLTEMSAHKDVEPSAALPQSRAMRPAAQERR